MELAIFPPVVAVPLQAAVGRSGLTALSSRVESPHSSLKEELRFFARVAARQGIWRPQGFPAVYAPLMVFRSAAARENARVRVRLAIT